RSRTEVAHPLAVNPPTLVGATATEPGRETRYIARIDIQHDYSTLDLPPAMPRELLTHLKKVWVPGQQLNMRKLEEGEAPAAAPSKPKFPRGPKPAARPNRPMDRAGAPHRKGPPKPRGPRSE
ncbi:DbpA RNA binding domain-containing protein, partial [Xanthomonas campestris]|uniref:DbpA RNA binding domain-containing protein n=1 Tax=Xanthomonas campestris TaxID=339 RepID=UPI0040391E62